MWAQMPGVSPENDAKDHHSDDGVLSHNCDRCGCKHNHDKELLSEIIKTTENH